MADGAMNVTITLPDGAERTYTTGVTGGEVADDISKSLGKAALAAAQRRTPPMTLSTQRRR